jgi:pilus assembly protein CpaB
MRTRSIILLALALGCGLVASIGISQFMDQRTQTEEAGERQPVFVALTDIRPNEELTAQNIKLEEWPKRIIPAGALTKLEEVEGKRTRLKVYAGEPILASKLLGAEDLTGAARDIPPGYRVAYVKVDPVSGSSNLILPGDRVDVLVFRHPNNDLNATAAKIVLQDIKVFAVDTQTETEFTANKEEQSEPMTAKTISLLVTPQQAVVLHAATELGGSVRLVMRNPEDDAQVADHGATIGDIFGKDTQRTDREAEKATETETSDITSWLSGEENKQSQQAGAALGNATPLPKLPPTPGTPRRMLVMLGAELLQVDIPGTGELPVVQSQSGPADLGGNEPGPSFGGEDQGPVVPPDDGSEADEAGEGESDSPPPQDERGGS